MISPLSRKARDTYAAIVRSIAKHIKPDAKSGSLDNTHTNAAEAEICTVQSAHEHNANPETQPTASPKGHARPSSRRYTQLSDTETIIQQLAVIAAHIDRSHSYTTRCSRNPTLPASAHLRSATAGSFKGQYDVAEGVESFYYLCSLISISHASSQQTPVITNIEVLGGQPVSRKRASSRISLRLGDFSSMSFPRVASKACPRYSPLPPLNKYAEVATHPQVRF